MIETTVETKRWGRSVVLTEILRVNGVLYGREVCALPEIAEERLADGHFILAEVHRSDSLPHVLCGRCQGAIFFVQLGKNEVHAVCAVCGKRGINLLPMRKTS